MRKWVDTIGGRRTAALVLTSVFVVVIRCAAQADCIARSLTALAIVQGGDVVTTSGPITRSFPGGFVTRDQLVIHCIPFDTAPTPQLCPYSYEADPIARRSGCVNSLAANAFCATVINLAARKAEYAWLRNASPLTKNRVCLANYVVALAYMALIWPDNFRLDYALAKTNPNPKTFRFVFARLRL
jgi:hypothetical protein